MLYPKAGPDHSSNYLLSVCLVSPWHPSLCVEIIFIVSSITVGTDNNILTFIAWTQKKHELEEKS